MKSRLLFCNLMAICSVLFLIACGGGDTADKAVSSSSEWDGTIFINVGPEPKTIDPTLVAALDAAYYADHAFEGLTTKDANAKISPGVAERWTVSDDGLVYTFYLRDNAKWSDGEPVVADDFVYTWQRAVDPIVASEYSYQFEFVKNAMNIISGEMEKEALGVRAIDNKTLEVILESPTAFFLELTAFTTYKPVRKDIIEKYGDTWTHKAETYIGNGPFKLVQRNIDASLVMEKNPQYWNFDSIIPKKLVFVLMQNQTAAVGGIKSRTLHFSTDPPAQDIPVLLQDGILQIKPYLGTYYYAMNITNEFLKDVRVRKALSLVIDRNYIVSQVTKGGEMPASAWVPYGLNDSTGDFRMNGGDYYSVKEDNYDKNVAEAKKLFADAGYPNGNGFPVLEFKTDPGTHTAIFEAVQQMWKEHLGIDSSMSQEEWAVFQDTRREKRFVIARHRWIGDYNDPMTMMGVFLSYSSMNDGGYNNPEYDKLVQAAMATGDQKIRMEAMHKAEDLLLNEVGLIPIYFFTNVILIDPKLKGIIFDTLGVHKFYYAYLEN